MVGHRAVVALSVLSILQLASIASLAASLRLVQLEPRLWSPNLDGVL